MNDFFTYTVIPEFLRQREQRVFGLLTPFQMLAAVGGMLPMVLAAQANVVLLIPVGLLVAVAVYAMSPHEGSFLFLFWVQPIRVFLAPRSLSGFTGFEAVGWTNDKQVPLVVRDSDGGIAMATALKEKK